MIIIIYNDYLYVLMQLQEIDWNVLRSSVI